MKVILTRIIFLASMILICCLSSCNYQKKYIRNDYRFYDRNFLLADSSLLKTDGVYTAADKIYKFYRTGQVNMILDPERRLNGPEAYINAFNQHITNGRMKAKPTLFEGYYRIQGRHIVIQQMVTPRKQFTYTYAILDHKNLIMFKTSHVGRGKFMNKHFDNGSGTSCQFVPTKGQYLAPNW